MAMDKEDLDPDQTGTEEGDQVQDDDGLVSRPEAVGESESTVSLIDLFAQCVNFLPLMASMQERYAKLSEELLYLRDEKLREATQKDIDDLTNRISQFGQRGERIKKRLESIMVVVGGKPYNALAAMQEAQRISSVVENLESMANSMVTNPMLGQAAPQVVTAIREESRRQGRLLGDFTSILLLVRVDDKDLEDLRLLWRHVDTGTKISLHWDVVDHRWVLPNDVKGIKAFNQVIDHLSEVHAPSAQADDVLEVVGYPVPTGWRFEHRLIRDNRCSNLT